MVDDASPRRDYIFLSSLRVGAREQSQGVGGENLVSAPVQKLKAVRHTSSSANRHIGNAVSVTNAKFDNSVDMPASVTLLSCRSRYASSVKSSCMTNASCT